MKVTIFLLLLSGTLSCPNYNILPDDTAVQIWEFEDAEYRISEYDKSTIVDEKKAYVIIRIKQHQSEVGLIYLMGTKLSELTRMIAMRAIPLSINAFFKKFSSVNTHITRKTVNSTEETFEAILNSIPKIFPRLYKLTEFGQIEQIQLISNLIKSNNSFLLDEGIVMTLYHEQDAPAETKEQALSVAKLIIKERGVNPDHIDNLITILDTTAKRNFIEKIMNAAKENPPYDMAKIQIPEQERKIFYRGRNTAKNINKLRHASTLLNTKTILFLTDPNNSEIFIYLGKKAFVQHGEIIITKVENSYAEMSSLNMNPKVTIVCEDEPLPFHFHLHFEGNNIFDASTSSSN